MMLIDDDDDVSYRRCVCLSVCPSVTNPLRQMNVISCGFHRQVVLRLVFKQILYGGSQTRINFLVFFSLARLLTVCRSLRRCFMYTVRLRCVPNSFSYEYMAMDMDMDICSGLVD